MIKISAVSYLNTIPFISGLEKNLLNSNIDLQLDIPAICAKKLINGHVDIALVPIIVIPELQDYNIVSDYCIGSNGAVDTVCLYSNNPISQVENVILDYQSRTSVILLKILLEEFWKIKPSFIEGKLGYENNIKENNAALVIGDRTFQLNDRYKYIYDLSAIWKTMTNLPFVFAVWLANKNVSKDFIKIFNLSLKKGLSKIDENLVKEKAKIINCKDPKDYLNNKICYNLNTKMKEGMALFLKKYKSLSISHSLFLFSLHLF